MNDKTHNQIHLTRLSAGAGLGAISVGWIFNTKSPSSRPIFGLHNTGADGATAQTGQPLILHKQTTLLVEKMRWVHS